MPNQVNTCQTAEDGAAEPDPETLRECAAAKPIHVLVHIALTEPALANCRVVRPQRGVLANIQLTILDSRSCSIPLCKPLLPRSRTL